MPLISVSANSIDAAGLELDAELPVAWLDDELSDASVTATAPGHFTTRLSSTEAPGGHGAKAIVVRGHVRASLTTPCARCTRPATVDVDTEMTLLLQPAAPVKKPAAKPAAAKPAADKRKAQEEEYEFTADEADTDTYDGETVELDAFVREAILLEVPNFPLCSEDCPGIGPAAEPAPESPSILDPRLAPLAAIRDGLRAKLSTEKKKE